MLVTLAGVSGDGQRVVAGLGQDVMSLPEDLAGLGQAGALAVLAVLDRGVVAVVRGRGTGVRLAGLLDGPAQHRRPLPGQPPGRALAAEEDMVMSSPANRTAWREEENRPAPPSQQVIASAVTGPAPDSRAASAVAPARCRAASVS